MSDEMHESQNESTSQQSQEITETELDNVAGGLNFTSDQKLLNFAITDGTSNTLQSNIVSKIEVHPGGVN